MGKRVNYDEIRRLRGEGLTIPTIAARLGCSESTVQNALRAMGITTGPRVFKADREKLLELWNQGLTLIEMGLALGCSASTMSGLIRAHNLPERRRPNMSVGADPTPAEIAERARECRERHYAQRRAETSECSRIKTWRQDA